MIIITWNVQWCRGMDGHVDPGRIAHTARKLADFDVLCLQEVAINFAGLPGSRGEDQMAELSAALPGYIGLFLPATDVDDGRGSRRQFGNAIFSRSAPAQAFRHLLPWPADESVPSMQRGALEAIVRGPRGPLRILSTHLEYYSALQRMTQVAHLLHLHEEACAQAERPRPSGEAGSPTQAVARPASAMLCGDCNFKPDSAEYARLTAAPVRAGIPGWIDAWSACNPGRPHPPTFFVHDPSESAYCCDFVFVTDDLVPSLRSIVVPQEIDASDHQPVVVLLED